MCLALASAGPPAAGSRAIVCMGERLGVCFLLQHKPAVLAATLGASPQPVEHPQLAQPLDGTGDGALAIILNGNF